MSKSPGSGVAWADELADRLRKYSWPWKSHRPKFDGPLTLPALVAETENHLEARKSVKSRQSWRSLRAEAQWTSSNLGQELKRIRSGTQRSAWKAFALLPGLLDKPSAVRRLRLNVGRLRALTEDPTTLVASWRDVVSAHQDSSATSQLREFRVRLFLSLAQSQGLSPETISSRLAGILRGSSMEIALLHRSMGEDVPIPVPDGRLDMADEELLDLCDRFLRASPPQGESVVYLAFDQARTMTAGPIEVGSVSFIDGMLLNSLLQHRGDDERIPPELKRDDPMIRFPFKDLPESGEYVLVRVDLGRGPAAGALGRAESIAHGLVALAGFHQGGTSWRPLEGYVHFLDGELSGHSPFQPPRPELVSVAMDPTSEWLVRNSQGLKPHIPAEGSQLKAAVDELTWLLKARELPDAQRLSLSQRIGEWVSTALGGDDVWHVIKNHMKSWWIATEAQWWLFNVAASAASHLTGSFGPKDENAASHVKAFAPKGIAAGIDLARFVSTVRKLVPYVKDAQLRTELVDIARFTSTPQEAQCWVSNRSSEFKILTDRAQRVRNSAIHGRSLEPESVESAATFLSGVVSSMLAIWIEGIVRGGNPTRWFMAETARVERKLMSQRKTPTRIFFA